MNQPLNMPTVPSAERERHRADLITSTSRLAFEIEACERRAPHLAAHGIKSPHQLRLRERFHREMAELMALTPAWCPDKAAVIRDNRQGHLDLAGTYQRELDRLEGQGA